MASHENPRMSTNGELLLLWAMPVVWLIWFACFLGFPGFVQPMSPRMSAEEVSAFYFDSENLPRIRYSMIVFNWFGVALIPMLAMIAMQIQLHNAFHEALVSRCDNETLKAFRRQLFEKAERYRRLAGRLVQHERDVGEEHRSIYRAAIKHDGYLAAALLASHIRETAENLLTADAERLGVG